MNFIREGLVDAAIIILLGIVVVAGPLLATALMVLQ